MPGPDDRGTALRAELAKVDQLISAHPLASQPIRAAGARVEERGSRSPAEVDEQLAADGLPSVEDVGRTTASGMWSWWKLHRAKRRLDQKIQRALER